ncbi:MAG: helix-turn-helix transcriptional regulator [Sandaracinaceae bacterium]|jgi:LuxR family maltose regulon positive regulatory protein|nr:helix-turn-helix transcriptional regulator [Sandaracinaceae bacterium]
MAELPRGLRAYEVELDGVRHLVFEHVLDATEGRRGLSQAEREIVALLEEGLSDREIGLRRGVTRSTLTKQIQSIFRKLGVSSRRELLARPR